MKKIAFVLFTVAALAACHHKKPAASGGDPGAGSGSAMGSAAPAGSGDTGGAAAGSGM